MDLLKDLKYAEYLHKQFGRDGLTTRPERLKIIHRLNNSSTGQFIDWTIHLLDNLSTEQFIYWTIYPLNNSLAGQIID
ncbi:hypothetical protein O3M35_012233 [Rhynocoris fuscipes]|uniref:Uncharacterized protein n=1 Tax=Rhynocoris fuscipes TaxID=488301 RepID=A0AAW1CSU2_9HEMI